MDRRQAVLTDHQVREVASEVLTGRFNQFGFTALEINPDEDMDGAAILRMIAKVKNKVPARDLIETLLAVQTALENKGEERTIFLSTRVSGIEIPVEEDEE